MLCFNCFFFQSFNEYFSAEHGRLLALWRQVVAFRRSFGDLKTATERDLSHVRNDVTRASRSMHSACLNLAANQRNQDTQSQVTHLSQVSHLAALLHPLSHSK